MTSPESPFLPEHFRRADETPDADFYAVPRLVTHIDDAAIAAVEAFYGQVLPHGVAILDLMSSWISNLPADGRYASITGLGMNEQELATNPQLARRVVHDLNREPALPFRDEEFGGAVITVSVQYLTQPVDVFAEVGRVLAPGAPLVVTFSNRCFPTKAVAVWQMVDDRGHAELVGAYMRLSGWFEQAQAFDLSPNPGRTDPLFAVVAHRRMIEEGVAVGR